MNILETLQHGEIEVEGRMPYSSNATFLVNLTLGDQVGKGIYKPLRGERPLWDFPSGLYQREVAAYLDVVSAESVQGINVVRDMFAGMRDFFGGRSQTLEKALREARAQATDELKERAAKLQADAVVGVNFEISMPSGKGSMLVVFVTGTAVRLK